MNYRGGIPLGVTQMPKTLYGRYSGALSAPSRDQILNYLEAARRSGTRVMLALVGNERYYKDSRGHFRLWQVEGTDGSVQGH